MSRQVTEMDFRMSEYRDAKVEDYEFRDDSALVRKDRWEVAVREIAEILGFDTRNGFEIDSVVAEIQRISGYKH